MSGDIPDRQEENISEIDEENTEPPDYRILLHNDVYPLEMAETKINQGTTLARENGFPLKLTMEKE
jgi:ATP-dependent Clp protease adapter protein ClpS